MYIFCRIFNNVCWAGNPYSIASDQLYLEMTDYMMQRPDENWIKSQINIAVSVFRRHLFFNNND